MVTRGIKKRKVDSLFVKRIDEIFSVFYPVTADRAIILHVKDEMNNRRLKIHSLSTTRKQNG